MSLMSLKYNSSPKPSWWQGDKYCVPSALCDILLAQYHLRTGLNPGPLSPQYTIIKAVESTAHLSRWDRNKIVLSHGWSSVRLGYTLGADHGACLETECPTSASKATTSMNMSAARFKLGHELVGYETVRDYPTTLDWIAKKKGNAVLVSSSGREGCAFLGIENGLGVCVNHYNQPIGKPFQPTLAEGDALIRRLIQNGSPENFIVGLTSL